jgi:uncharacterized protein (DUF58 family)
MNFGSGKISKFDFASMLALGFAYLVNKENEKFGLATFSTKLKDIMPPKRGKRQFFEAMDTLNKQELGGLTDLGEVGERYGALIKSRSLSIVISDFLEPLDSIQKGLFRLAKKSKNFIVVHVADPAEKKLDWQGDVKLYDLETNQEKKIFFTPQMRKEYGVKYVKHVEGVRKAAESVGADFFSVSSGDPVFDIFFEITHLVTRGHNR